MRRARLRTSAALLVSVAIHAAVFGVGLLVVVRRPSVHLGIDETPSDSTSMAVPTLEASPEPALEPEPVETEHPPLEFAPDVRTSALDPFVDAPPPESDESLPESPDTPPVAVADEPLPGPSVGGLRLRPKASTAPMTAPIAVAPRPAQPSPVPPPAASGRSPLREIEAPRPPFTTDAPPGTVLVLVLEYTIAADGRVVDARVVASSGDATLDTATADFIVARWRYEPPGAARRVQRRFVFTKG